MPFDYSVVSSDFVKVVNWRINGDGVEPVSKDRVHVNDHLVFGFGESTTLDVGS